MVSKSRKVRRSLVAASFAAALVAAGCSSPEQRIEAFTQSGEDLLAQEEYVQAGLEFRNALRIDDEHLPALRGLLTVREQTAGADPDSINQTAATLNRIVELDPSDVESRVKLGKFMLLTGTMDEAVRLSDEALALAPEGAEALALSASVRARLEDFGQATERANKALEINPTQADAYIVLAAERMAANDVRAAIAHLDAGIDAGVEGDYLVLIKLQLLEELEDIEGATAVYERLVDLRADDVGVQRGYAQFLLRNGNTEDGRAVIEKMVADNPDDDQPVYDLISLIAATEGAEAAEARLSAFVASSPERYALRRSLAQIKTANGDREGAAEILTEVSKDAGGEPDGLAAETTLATLSLDDGDTEDARARVDAVLSEDARQVDALYLKSRIAIQEGRLDEAVADLRTALTEAPNSAPILGLLARAHELAGSTDLAEDQYSNAFRVSGAEAGPSLAYANFLGRRGRLELAENVLGDALERSPNSPDVWRALGQVRLFRNDWVGAQQVADRLRELGENEQVANEISGAAYQGQQELGQSIDAFRRAHEAAPTNGRPLAALIRAYVAADRIEDARSFLQGFIDANENNAFARVLMAQVYELEGDLQAAEATLVTARELDSSTPFVHYSLHTHYMRNDRLDAAGRAVAEGLEAHPDDVGMRLYEAGYLELAGDIEGAINRYEAFVEDYPTSAVATNNLASLLSDNRDDEESLLRARSLAERFRDSPVPHFRDTLGWLHLRLGQTDQAERILESVVEQRPDSATFRYHLGVTYIEQGATDAARTELEQVIELASDREAELADKARLRLETL